MAKYYKLILEIPGKKKRQFKFDVESFDIQNDYSYISYPEPFGSNMFTGRGIITARFVNRKNVNSERR